MERSETNGEDGVEDEDESDKRGTRRSASGLVVDTNRNDGGDPDNAAADVCKEQKWATTGLVDEESTEDGESELHAGKSKVDVHLLGLIGDTSALENTGDEVRDGTVASPLAEDGDCDVATHTVTSSSGVEESTIIPPAFVGTVHLKMLAVFAQLHLHPDAVGVTFAMVFRKHSLRSLVMATGVQPSRRFRKSPSTGKDETWEEELKPDWEDPTLVSWKIFGTTGGTRCEDGAHKPKSSQNNITSAERKLHNSPESVVDGGNNTTSGRVSSLNNEHGSSGSQDGDTESEQETTTHELANGIVLWLCGRLNNDTQNGDGAADAHADFASPGIRARSDEWQGNDASDLIHGCDNAGPSTSRFDMVVLLERFVGEERVEHAAVESIASRAEEADEGAEEEYNGVGIEVVNRLLDLSLCERLRACDHLDFNNSLLVDLRKAVSDGGGRNEGIRSGTHGIGIIFRNRLGDGVGHVVSGHDSGL